jgi:hypothetical protein
MNSATFFFLYILPFVIAGGGWLAVILNERHERYLQRKVLSKVLARSGK